MRIRLLALLAPAALSAAAWQSPSQSGQPAAAQTVSANPAPGFVVETGTKVPLSLLNSISTKSAAVGDRIYLETIFPILSGGRVVIPPGSYVAGTVTGVKRAGKVKGRAELYVRFDSLTLPNGVTRDFRARAGTLDGTARGELDREEGKIKGEGNKGGDATKVGEAAAWGTMIGGVASQTGTGAGIGAAAGAAAGLVGVMFTRGPDAVLERGSTIEMVLDRNLRFDNEEIDFGPMQQRPKSAPTPQPSPSSTGLGKRPFPSH